MTRANNRHTVASLNETPIRNQPGFDDAFQKDAGCPELAATVTGLLRLANFFMMSVLKAANTKNVTALPLPTLRQIKALAGFS